MSLTIQLGKKRRKKASQISSIREPDVDYCKLVDKLAQLTIN